MRGRSKRSNAGLHRGRSPQPPNKKKKISNKTQSIPTNSTLLSHEHVRSSDQSFSIEYFQEEGTRFPTNTSIPTVDTSYQNTVTLHGFDSTLTTCISHESFTLQRPIYSVCQNSSTSSYSSSLFPYTQYTVNSLASQEVMQSSQCVPNPTNISSSTIFGQMIPAPVNRLPYLQIGANTIVSLISNEMGSDTLLLNGTPASEANVSATMVTSHEHIALQSQPEVIGTAPMSISSASVPHEVLNSHSNRHSLPQQFGLSATQNQFCNSTNSLMSHDYYNRPIPSLSSAQPSVPQGIPVKHFNTHIGPEGQIQYIPVLVNQSHQTTNNPKAPQPVPVHSTFSKGGNPGETVHIYVNLDTQEKVFGNWAIPMAALLEEDPTLGANKIQHHKKPKIPVKDRVLTLEQFTIAFTRFASLLVSRYCHLAPGLITHLHQVLQVARDGGDWAAFDMQIRKHIQHGHRKWGDICTEFSVQAVQSGIRNLIQGQPKSGGIMNKRTQEKIPPGYCFNFHINGSCDKQKQICKGRFKHLCYHCQGEHRAAECTKASHGKPPVTQKSDQSFRARKY